MGYDDMKVTEAYKFFSSIADGRQHQASIHEFVSTMQVVDTMDRSCESGRWE